MKTMNFRKWVTWLMAICCLSVVTARAVGPEVRDNAGLFSTAAIKQADETIRNIQREFRKDLLVETFAGVPEQRKQDYERSREEFFAGFVRERAQAARLDGVYVLIMKEPPPHRLRIQVGVGQATRKRAFLAGDREQLVKLLQTSFREEKYDEGLRAGVAFVEQAMRSNNFGRLGASGSTTKTAISTAPVREMAPRSSSASHDSGGSPLILVLLIVAGIFAVSFLTRVLRGGFGGGGVAGPGGMLGGGGGFFSSLLAGIGGAMAGSWLYDRFFGNHSQSGDDNWATSAADAPPSDIGGDFASSGGDVDSGSSFGSADFDGGGDFGGGGDV